MKNNSIKKGLKKYRGMGRYDDMPRALQKGKYWFCFCMVALQVLAFCVLSLGTKLQTISLAFQRVIGVDDNGFEIMEWTTSNFTQALSLLKGGLHSDMGIALRNTMLYFIAVEFVMNPISFVLAYFFKKNLKGTKFFRVIIYLPNIISQVAIVSMFKCVIAPNGPVAEILYKAFDYELPSLLRNESTATPTILFYSLFFGIQVNQLLFQGAFNRIPQEILEAAELDGVNDFQELTKIMLPIMWPTLSTILLLGLTDIFGATGPILLFTGGMYETTTFNYWIYDQVKVQGYTNLPSAMGLILTLINIPLVIIFRWLSGKVEDVQF